MWVYRQGEISHSLAASEGPIHVITRIVCQLERAYIFSALEKKSRVCLVNKRRKTIRKKCLSPAKKYKLYKSSINKSLHFAQRRLSSSTRG